MEPFNKREDWLDAIIVASWFFLPPLGFLLGLYVVYVVNPI